MKHPAFLLTFGAVLGAVLATSGLLEPASPALPGSTVASVNGEPVSKSEYLAYLDVLARDKRNPMTASDRSHVLDRLIEEKLMIARGLEIGLPYSDPQLRKSIVNVMIQTIISDVASAEPELAELEQFYQDNLAYFTAPARAQVRRLVFHGGGAQARASAAHIRLADEDWQRVARELADEDILALPNSLLPLSKLRGYLGPSLTGAALALQPGDYSAPQAGQAGYSILQLVALQADEPQPLATIREQVAREYQRRAGDAALRGYLQQLRSSAEVQIDQDFLRQLHELSPSNNTMSE